MFHVFMKGDAVCILKSDKIMVEMHFHLVLKQRDKNYVLYEPFYNFIKLQSINKINYACKEKSIFQ